MFVVKAENKSFTTLKEVATFLGRKQVARRDMAKLGIEEVVDAPAVVTPEPVKTPEEPKTPEVTEPAKEAPVAEPAKEEVKEAPQATDKKDDTKVQETSKPADNKNEDKEPTAEQLAKAQELQAKYNFTNVDQMGEILRKKKVEEVIELAKEMGVSWKENTNVGVNRMRASMAIREALFPGERRKPSEKSGWATLSTDELTKLAKKNKLTWRETIDERINRMWIIKALKDAGVEIPQK